MKEDLTIKKSKKKAQIIVVDDDKTIRQSIYSYLHMRHYNNIDTANSGREALELIKKKGYDIMLLDLKLPDISGLEVLKKVKDYDNNISVIMITGYGTIETAVQAIKRGADDYLLKPFKSFAILDLRITKLLEHRNLRAEYSYIKEQLDVSRGMNNIVGKSKKMLDVFNLIKKVSPSNSTILIEGESGTGKELVAKAIHKNSPRSENRFVALNCGAIPAQLLESELFGFEKGAFTGADYHKKGLFEVADGGIIFLDEISEMPKALQVKLLRVIQERRFQHIGGIDEIETNVRIIASSNRNLETEVKKSRFRKDLYYRINVIKIVVPPLRDRREDIPLLANYFLKKYSKEIGKNIESISPKVMSALVNYVWDGNVRELENIIERAVIMSEKAEITESDIPEHIFNYNISTLNNFKLLPFQEAKKEFERYYLDKVMKKTRGNISEASRITLIPRQNIYEKLKRYEIKVENYR